MKTEVKTTKRFWRRGNVLDIAVVLLLLAAIVSIGYRYYMTNHAVDEEALDDYTVTFRAERVLPGVAEALKVGDDVYFSDGERMGALMLHPKAQGGAAVATAAADTPVLNAAGEYVLVSIPDGSYLDIEGTVACVGLQTEAGSILLNGTTELTPGQVLTVRSETVTFSLTVIAVTAK